MNETQGLSVPWAFKLDLFQPVKQILFQNVSPLYPAYHNKPKERKEGDGRAARGSSKWEVTERNIVGIFTKPLNSKPNLTSAIRRQILLVPDPRCHIPYER